MNQHCQIQSVNDIAIKSPFSLKREQIFWKIRLTLRKIKFLRNLKRRFARKNDPKYQALLTSVGSISATSEKDKKHKKKTSQSISEPLQKGDKVRVLSKKEIARMLDDDYKYKGCFFMEEMWQYCGTEQKVLTRVEYFFDEFTGMMRKAKNTVLLEGLLCSGDMHWKHKCDRNCFFFWREEWMKKI